MSYRNHEPENRAMNNSHAPETDCTPTFPAAMLSAPADRFSGVVESLDQIPN